MNPSATTPAYPATLGRGRTSASGLYMLLCVGQGLFYLATGIWPLVSIDTFQMVTGPKTDLWLVDTVGVLVTVIGVVLLVAAWRGRFTPEVLVLAIGSAAVLTGIDVIYVSRGVILPVYLADAAAELVLIGAWSVVLLQQARASSADGIR